MAILKPDKGNGTALIDIKDYENCVATLFSNVTKLRKVEIDPTPARLATDFKTMRPKNTKPARAHGLRKMHKTFDRLPKFRPIIDTTGTTYYSVDKYLTSLLNPLFTNSFTLKDSFDTAQ